jgi:putative membrane protein
VNVSDLPTLNASLNATSAIFLCIGFVFIRRGNIAAHKACMLTAFAASIVFLASYLYYHFHVGSVRFTGEGWVRPVYFSILISHTILAAAIVPLALITLWRAFREKFDKHKRLARWTLPIWLYVSVTGVVIYGMLYHL